MSKSSVGGGLVKSHGLGRGRASSKRRDFTGRGCGRVFRIVAYSKGNRQSRAAVFAGAVPPFAGVASRFDPGSRDGALQLNFQVGLPNLTLDRAWGHAWEWRGSGATTGDSRAGINFLSGLSIVGQYQYLGGNSGAKGVFRQSGSIGGAVNIADLQIRSHSTEDTKSLPAGFHALVDVQLQFQVLRQLLGTPAGTDASQPGSAHATQVSLGLNIDVHVAAHVSVLFQAGLQGVTTGQGFQFGFAGILLGVGAHSQNQFQ